MEGVCVSVYAQLYAIQKLSFDQSRTCVKRQTATGTLYSTWCKYGSSRVPIDRQVGDRLEMALVKLYTFIFSYL